LTATLKLTREGVGIELRRGRFDILLDGNSVGMVEWHDTLEVRIESGRHRIQVRSGRYSSQGHTFDVADGEMVTFQVHGAMVWPRWVISMLKPDLGISLKRA
jgi:hypothetical protein